MNTIVAAGTALHRVDPAVAIVEATSPCSCAGAVRTFADLLAPVGVEQFVTDHLEQHPFLRRGCGAHHRSLFGIDDIDSAVAAAPHDPDAPMPAAYGFRFVDGQRQIYRFDAHGPTGRSNTAAARAFDEGYTVVANTAQRHHADIARLCSSMEARLQQRVGANVYLTPPGTQGFAPHTDDHDTFLLQIEGRKRWALWQPDQPLPLTGNTSDEAPPPRPPDIEVEVTAGDLFYIPRGWWHQGITPADDVSLHVTLGLISMRWVDVLVAAVKRRADDDIALRRHVPFAGPETAFAEMADDLWGTAQRMLAELARTDARFGEETLSSLWTTQLETHHPPFERRFRSTATRWAIGIDDRVERRDGLRPLVTDDDDGACKLVFVGGFVRGPSDAREAMEFVASASSFRAGDLPGLSGDLQVQLVQELVLQGFVRPIRPA